MERYRNKMDNAVIIDLVLGNISNALNRANKDMPIHVALTGGSTGKEVMRRLGSIAADTEPSVWDRVHLWWGDERFVDCNSAERNDFQIHEILGSYYSSNRIHRVLGSDQCDSVEAAAADYTKRLLSFGNHGPRFTFVLLSLGPDGHVASLFPYSEQLTQTEPCVAVVNAPKIPRQRVTMTFVMLNRSEHTMLLALGESKRLALQRLNDPEGSISMTPGRGISAKNLQIIG
jgi:6-phosphogluconolactonase